MNVLEAIIQGIVQGLTEFLPVSSSGHLAITQHVLGVGEEASLFFDVADTLEAIRSAEVPQVIISATEQNMLDSQLRSLGIDGFFEAALGLDNIHAGSKLELAKSWRKDHEGKAIYIGDTDHDAETAKMIGAECFLIARGHQSREYLEEHTDVKIFSNLSELLEYLKIKS
jgi:phosphoglycolate phosphatase